MLEVLQAFTRDRDPDYLDIPANGTGVAFGWANRVSEDVWGS